MGKIEEIVRTAKQLGQSACGLTDHGSTSGLYEFQKVCETHNIKPILGTEFYYERENDGKNGHIIALAKNNKGLENIFKLQEYAYVNNFYYRPRINFDMLKHYSEGLIVTSACLASTLGQYLIDGDIVNAKGWIRKFRNLFGEDFYLEIQPNSLPEQLLVNKRINTIAKEFGIKVIATNDVHYVYESDAFSHEVLLAIQSKKKMSDEKRFKFDTNDFWLKSREEMLQTFIGLPSVDVENALNNTLEIVEKCNAHINKGKYLPKFWNVPEGKTERELLVEEVKKGLVREGLHKDRNYVKEVQHEIDVIDRNGYSGYFLIVQDYVTSARRNGNIVGDGRGSGAGSKVAYLTEITKIAPHKYDLLFERFMADGRSPDFDVDFSDQDAVFQDLQRKYGVENVAHIITFGKMTPKAVARKILGCFEHDTAEINYISKLIGDVDTMEEAFNNSSELRHIKQKYKLEFDVIERLEGVISHEGQHAGGIIIYPNLSSILPIKTKSDDRTKRIVGFDKYMLEELGHYKFDILGLETLPVIRRTLDSIKNTTGQEINLYTINYDDTNVYNMLSNGDVSGVFQLANQAQKVMEQQPNNFKDLIAINALIRPGVGDWDEYIARRKGKEWTVYPPRKPYMEETMGLITYQEQFLLDAKTLAGWDIAFADKHIRKNKRIKDDEELKEKFITDCMKGDANLQIAEAVWQEIVDAVSGGYSFNKSHSASYAVLSYQTAWLKYYYPEHFYASMMSSEKTDGDGQDAIAGYIAECKQRGISILPPDINNSGEHFVVTDKGINYRITTIKHVGDSAICNIKELRPIKNFQDFLERREKKFVKKNVIVNLIKAGAFDFDNPNRAELLWQFDMACRTKTQIKENYQCPQYEWNDKIKAEWEKEVLGMYLSIHPMEKYGFKPLEQYVDGQACIVGGEVYDMRVFQDKNKNEMAFVFINTLFGNIKLLVFASTWRNKKIQEPLQLNNIVLIRGRRSGNDVIVNEVEILE